MLSPQGLWVAEDGMEKESWESYLQTKPMTGSPTVRFSKVVILGEDEIVLHGWSRLTKHNI